MTSVSVDDRLDAVLRTLADRVRQLRQERDLSVTALSFEAGVSESRVRAIESGRTTASLATLVALAETFEIDLPELFGHADRGGDHGERPGSHVVPSEVVWGGELPPAPWMTAPAPVPSPPVVPSEAVWGGELPTASWTNAKSTPETRTAAANTGAAADREPAVPPTEKTWGGPLPPAPWIAPARGVSTPAAPEPAMRGGYPEHPVTTPSPAPPEPPRAAARGAEAASRYVRIAPDATLPREPRTFSDLREGSLAGREFRSLREFAVAAVAEADHSVVTVARIFRLPAWKLERWVAEAGYVGRG